jgi:hypothetical protein
LQIVNLLQQKFAFQKKPYYTVQNNCGIRALLATARLCMFKGISRHHQERFSRPPVPTVSLFCRRPFSLGTSFRNPFRQPKKSG